MKIFDNQEELKIAILSTDGKDYNPEDVEKYAAYCLKTKNERNKRNEFKNPWMQNKTVQNLASLFRQVHNEGLKFDGKYVTLQSTGISYDYHAYKNKMMLAYPESKIDLQLVYKGDQFDFKKINGTVIYNHEIGDPFSQKDENIVGGYCIIKNKRGEFLTLLSKEEIEKRRKVAKTDYIWKNWFPEMCLKTIIRKAVSLHFEDVFEEMNETDNEHYDLDNTETTRLEKLNREIVDLLDGYQGEDKKDIQKMCAEKRKAGEFTEEFAKNIISQLNGDS